MSIQPIAWQCDNCGGFVPVEQASCAACGHSRFANLGTTCGTCGSDDVHFAPCPECEYAQTFTCFGCGAMYVIGDGESHHDPACSSASRTGAPGTEEPA